jgi:hypothetical protein
MVSDTGMLNGESGDHAVGLDDLKDIQTFDYGGNESGPGAARLMFAAEYLRMCSLVGGDIVQIIWAYAR